MSVHDQRDLSRACVNESMASAHHSPSSGITAWSLPRTRALWNFRP